MESQKKYSPTFSFEFFPPKTPEGMDKLRATWRQLIQLKPRFFSVTYGAGGSTRDRTLEAVLEIQKDGGNAAPHLSCVGSSRADLAATLALYQTHGLRHIVALRGDLPSGAAGAGELRYANELVQFIRDSTGDHFHIEVACYPEFHPQARSANDDLRAFKRKVEAGANAAITQYFFNADAYFRFIDDCEVLGIDLPIVPGIMP
ncbi:MAG: methylenetetrahydrofolate reductase, partial [Burkholderiales bacterium]